MAFIVRAGGATFERIVGNEVRGPVIVVSSTYQVYEKDCLNITNREKNKTNKPYFELILRNLDFFLFVFDLSASREILILKGNFLESR